MGMAQYHYREDPDGKIRKAGKTIEIRQYVYLARPPMTRSATKCLVTEPYSDLLPFKMGPICVFKVLASTIKIGEDSICNTFSVACDTVAPTSKET